MFNISVITKSTSWSVNRYFQGKNNNQYHDHNIHLSKLPHNPSSKTNVRKFSVANKVVDIYNSLTDERRDCQSSYSFKRKLTIFIMREEVK